MYLFIKQKTNNNEMEYTLPTLTMYTGQIRIHLKY